MIRAMIALAASMVALPVLAAGSSSSVKHNQDDSFLYAAPSQGGPRVPNYVVDSARGHPMAYSERRQFQQRPSLSGESTGLKLQRR